MKRDVMLDFLRGAAIIAVVVCHQQYILHTSEYIQFISIYSVSALIALAGITRYISLSKKLSSKLNINNTVCYLAKAIWGILAPYILVTFICAIIEVGVNSDLPQYFFSRLLTFSASPPFYFVKYYLVLTLLSPLLFFSVNKCMSADKRTLKTGLFLMFVWIFSYKSITYFDFFAQSYLFVFVCGLIVGKIYPIKISLSKLLVSISLLCFGTISSYRFYFSLGKEDITYSGIDSWTPLLHLNPPTVSIILYSFGVISVLYCFCTYFKMYDTLGIKIISLLGKYSLDIFLWHFLIRDLLTEYIPTFLYRNTVVFKNILYYFLMFALPVTFRLLYQQLKNRGKTFFEQSKEKIINSGTAEIM